METKDQKILDEILKSHSYDQTAVIGIMQEIQKVYRYLPEEMLCYIAKKLHLSEANSCNSLINSLAFSGVMAGCTTSLTVQTGASPQAPRQDTVSTVNIISSVVGFASVTPKIPRISFRIAVD